MTSVLVTEQLLNGLQFGLMLFLLAAGLTLVFGVMDMINLAHGSLYMVGAFVAAWLVGFTGSFVLGVLGAAAITAVFGMALEAGLLRSLYARDHLSQVLATFALILILNDGVKMIFGTDMPLSAPDALSGSVQLLPGLQYPAYRLLILGAGLFLALLLYLLVQKTRLGALVRAGASNREMSGAMGVNIERLFTLVFGIGAAL
jgi:branched-chain amino acid transport system permease protein